MRDQYLAHSANEANKVELVREHLKAVARRAAEFASAFGASAEGALAGLLHDLGKYGHLFQRRLEGKERGIDHWSAGAWAALDRYRNKGIAAALAIQGHHIGLQQALEHYRSDLIYWHTEVGEITRSNKKPKQPARVIMQWGVRPVPEKTFCG